MPIPDYAVLLIIVTSLFVASSVSVMLTHGLHLANINAGDRRRFSIRVSFYALVWVGIALVIAKSNILVPSVDRAYPLLGVLILGSAIVGNILLFKSPTAKAVLDAIPVHWFASIQIYRIIGLVFLLLEADGLLSTYFASSTGWGDIAVGVTAPFVGYLLWRDAKRFQAVGIAWCIAGIADLLLVLYKAVNSAPGPLQSTAFDLPTIIIGYFPFTIVPLLVVPVSLILHVQMIRKLLVRT